MRIVAFARDRAGCCASASPADRAADLRLSRLRSAATMAGRRRAEDPITPLIAAPDRRCRDAPLLRVVPRRLVTPPRASRGSAVGHHYRDPRRAASRRFSLRRTRTQRQRAEVRSGVDQRWRRRRGIDRAAEVRSKELRQWQLRQQRDRPAEADEVVCAELRQGCADRPAGVRGAAAGERGAAAPGHKTSFLQALLVA
ncbi:hypothetical protein Scep_027972 [Stephania cephalantha]|uniref:Uncharacterized protein n=1 Tax=Stephania cephalantha TaxID=152367 RepID=A0AAP0HN18_9MAGN